MTGYAITEPRCLMELPLHPTSSEKEKETIFPSLLRRSINNTTAGRCRTVRSCAFATLAQPCTRSSWDDERRNTALPLLLLVVVYRPLTPTSNTHTHHDLLRNSLLLPSCATRRRFYTPRPSLKKPVVEQKCLPSSPTEHALTFIEHGVQFLSLSADLYRMPKWATPGSLFGTDFVVRYTFPTKIKFCTTLLYYTNIPPRAPTLTRPTIRLTAVRYG